MLSGQLRQRRQMRRPIVRHKHLIGCRFLVRESLIAIGALCGADDDLRAGAHVAHDQLIEQAPLLADGEFGASIV